jgi:hypothetical protein
MLHQSGDGAERREVIELTDGTVQRLGQDVEGVFGTKIPRR